MKLQLPLAKENSAFSPTIPGLQLYWDSTSLTALKRCPYLYYLTIVLGLQPRKGRPPLEFGIAFHESQEKYHAFLASGLSEADALLAVVEWTWIRQHTPGPHQITEGDPTRTPFTLLRAMVWYCDQFHNDPARTVILEDGKPATELSFRFHFDGDFFLCGHMDRLVEFSGDIFNTDYKTTKTTLNSKFFSQFSPDNQMSLYSLASKVVFETPAKGVMIDGIQLGVNFARFQRGFAPRSVGQLDEWIDDTKTWLHLSRQFAEARTWPQNDTSCHQYGGCPFREVCSKDPEIRINFLRAHYIQRKWDPKEPR